jgi:transcriptional regulator with XRE-family HTH domain
MAEELDVSHSTIAKWEVNRGQPRGFMKRIQQWADLTGVPVSWLLGVGAGRGEQQVLFHSAA